jgi:hypothetical protein
MKQTSSRKAIYRFLYFDIKTLQKEGLNRKRQEENEDSSGEVLFSNATDAL